MLCVLYVPNRARCLENTKCVVVNREHYRITVNSEGTSEALGGPVRLENGVDSTGMCPGLSITIQKIHPWLLLRTEKLLCHNPFSRARLVRSRKNGHAFEKSKNVT